MRHAALILVPLLLGACGEASEAPPERTAALEVPAPVPAPAPRPAPPGTELPPADAAYRYVGGWATTAAACADPPWRFEERRLTTAGEVACAFDRVEKTAAGYEIAATCTAQAPPAPYRLGLSFAESARAMLVDGGPFSEPVGLVWCGPLAKP